MRRTWWLLAICLVVGCRGGGTAQPGLSPRPTGAPTASSTAGAQPSGSATTASPPAGGITVIDTRYGSTGRFRTPSGNLKCEMDTNGAHCTVGSHTWKAPERDYPQECTQEKSHASVAITEAGSALRSDCYQWVDVATAVLPYGAGWQAGDTRCVSEQRGVTCLVLGSGKGFTVSRTAVSLTPQRSELVDRTAGARRPTADVRLPAGFHADFYPPSENLVCGLSEASTFCVVRYNTRWKPPPYDESSNGGPCDGDEYTSVFVEAGKRGTAETACRSDEPEHGGRLDYGYSVSVGDLRCTSARSGVTCRFGSDGHGFFVSSQAFRSY